MTPDWLLISIQGMAAIAALLVLRGMLLPALVQLQERSSVRDVWLPLVIVGPALFAAARGGHTVNAATWLATGLPVILGFAAIALAMLCEVQRMAIPVSAVVIWILTGIVFLLLCAMNELSIWTGQTAFAAGAVVLWLNTPDAGTMAPIKARRSIVLAVPLLVVCAAAQGMAVLHISEAQFSTVALLFVGTALVALMLVARRAGRQVCVYVGGWVAVYGVLFGIGLTSFLRMLPIVWQSMRSLVAGAQPVHMELQPRVVLYVAHGYGWLAVEAVMMIMLAGAAVGGMRLSVRSGRMVGVAALAGAGLLIAWRLQSFFAIG